MKGMTNFEPRTFTTRGGKNVTTRRHLANFDLKHNAAKAKIFIVLFHRLHRLKLTSGLTVGELHLQSGVGYDYLKSRVSKWCEWGYLGRRIRSTVGRPCFEYALAERGAHFVRIIPQEWLERYIAEIQAFTSRKGD